MTPSQAVKTLELALKDSQPKAYAQMKADGTLTQYLNRLAGQIEEQKAMAYEQLGNDPQYQKIADPTLRVQEANSRIKAAVDVALQQAIEEVQALEA